MKDRILSCIQPTGILHFGNYFGAIKNWVSLQKRYDCYYGVVDYHAMTVPYKPEILLANTHNMVKYLVACGVDSKNIFIQSMIPEHTEIAWILSCITPIGMLERQTQFKDKKQKLETENSSKNSISVGLFNYPILQAADILIYHANLIPVGKDQQQHIELSRFIARKFNTLFSEQYFKEPEALLTVTPKIKSLASPSNKMSKSLGDKHYVGCFEDSLSIKKKVMSAVTDSGSVNNGLSEGVENLLVILAACDKKEEKEEFERQALAGGLRYKDLKDQVALGLVELSEAMKNRLHRIDDQMLFDEVYETTFRIRNEARATVKEIRQRTGLPESLQGKLFSN